MKGIFLLLRFLRYWIIQMILPSTPQWRIHDFSDRAADSKVGAPTYNLLNFSRKLYANEKNWAERDEYEFFSVIKFTFLKLSTTDFRIIVLFHSQYYI